MSAWPPQDRALSCNHKGTTGCQSDYSMACCLCDPRPFAPSAPPAVCIYTRDWSRAGSICANCQEYYFAQVDQLSARVGRRSHTTLPSNPQHHQTRPRPQQVRFEGQSPSSTLPPEPPQLFSDVRTRQGTFNSQSPPDVAPIRAGHDNRQPQVAETTGPSLSPLGAYAADVGSFARPPDPNSFSVGVQDASQQSQSAQFTGNMAARSNHSSQDLMDIDPPGETNRQPNGTSPIPINHPQSQFANLEGYMQSLRTIAASSTANQENRASGLQAPPNSRLDNESFIPTYHVPIHSSSGQRHPSSENNAPLSTENATQNPPAGAPTQAPVSPSSYRTFHTNWQAYLRAETERRLNNTNNAAQNNSPYPNAQTMYPPQYVPSPYLHNDASQVNPLLPLNAQGQIYPPRADAQNAQAARTADASSIALNRASLMRNHSLRELPQHMSHIRRRHAQALSADYASATNTDIHAQSRRRSRRTDDGGAHQTAEPSRTGPMRGFRYYHEDSERQDDLNSGPVIFPYAEGHRLARMLYGEHAQLLNRGDMPGLSLALDPHHRPRPRSDIGQGQPAPAPKGLDNQNDGRPEPKESEELTINIECKVCMSQLIDTVVLPCGHAVLCRWCADQHIPSAKTDYTRPAGKASCPMCRKPVSRKVSD
ncbi:hypothetical protein AJ80_09046 [Polytolypa hystricis UAMH7299]|uniref:RING-type domain-containing protein n=1 Tax=Polytolypa hystricis (strain UAMH7299) TaxID=1447883 RepID=A0A2B7WXD3_POLH7|nr:hypothetical protein AJ80_09046 [Polytolypa hystricis UAMH7299]